MSYQERLLKVIPGGAHTYSRGFDQYPLNAPQILTRGKGAYIYDSDGNKYLDYGMALRAVNIGYAEDEAALCKKLSLNYLLIDDTFFVVPLIEAAVNEITDSFILKNWDRNNNLH